MASAIVPWPETMMAGVQQFALAQLAQEIDAAAIGKPDVEQQQVGAFGRRAWLRRCFAPA